jgi:hypothetical protein
MNNKKIISDAYLILNKAYERLLDYHTQYQRKEDLLIINSIQEFERKYGIEIEAGKFEAKGF